MEEAEIKIDAEAASETQSAWASDSVRNFVSDVNETLAKYPGLVEMNFALFYQKGRLGFMDLDAFAKTVTARTEEDGEMKTLEEIVDKEEE